MVCQTYMTVKPMPLSAFANFLFQVFKLESVPDPLHSLIYTEFSPSVELGRKRHIICAWE